MPLEAAPPRRLALVAIVAQAWLVGGGLGTCAGFALLTIIPGVGAGGLGGFALAGFSFFVVGSAFVGLVLSSPGLLAGMVFCVSAPHWLVRWRTPICLALPALVAALGAAFLLTAGHDTATAAVFPAVAVWDAAIAAYWVHRRTLPLARAQNPAALAAVFR